MAKVKLEPSELEEIAKWLESWFSDKEASKYYSIYDEPVTHVPGHCVERTREYCAINSVVTTTNTEIRIYSPIKGRLPLTISIGSEIEFHENGKISFNGKVAGHLATTWIEPCSKEEAGRSIAEEQMLDDMEQGY